MNTTTIADINISPETPPPFSVQYAAAVMLASTRKGAVIEFVGIKPPTPSHLGWLPIDHKGMWWWPENIYRIQPGSIVGTKEWFDKVPVAYIVQRSGLGGIPYVKLQDGTWVNDVSRVCSSYALASIAVDDWQILPPAKPLLQTCVCPNCKLTIVSDSMQTHSCEPEPAKHSREWANSLPNGTKLWAPKQDVGDEVAAPVTGEGPWYIVGTPEWAAALPEETKVTWHLWDADEYVVRYGKSWKKSNSTLHYPMEHGNDDSPNWQIYKLRLVPFTFETFPRGVVWIREEGERTISMVGSINPTFVGHVRGTITYASLLTDYEISLDNCATWIAAGQGSSEIPHPQRQSRRSQHTARARKG